MLMAFSSPAAICEQVRMPLAPFSRRSSIFASSSSCLPSIKEVKSAHTAPIFKPVMYSNRFHQPILEILHQYFTNGANCSCAHKVTCLTYRGVAGVVVSQRENEFFLFDQLYQLSCLSQVNGHRLIAHDMDAMLQE